MVTIRLLSGYIACGALLCLPLVAAAQQPVTGVAVDRFDALKTTALLLNGQKLAYIDVGARDAPPLVLVHGYTDSARDWAPLAPLLSARFRLIVVDLRGHGASAKPECCYSRFDFAYDIKLLLDSLAIKRADIAGHSLGSIVAQTFAELWPDSTHHLVLISSTGTAFTVADWKAPLATLTDPIDPDSAFMRDWWRVSIAYSEEFAQRQRRDAAAIPARVWRAIADQSLVGVDLEFMLARIRAPTLLIWGGRDVLVDTAGKLALQSHIVHSTTRTFSALGHDLFWEDPAAVAAVLTDFLSR